MMNEDTELDVTLNTFCTFKQASDRKISQHVYEC
jgi:hypothetical protein